MGEPMSNLPFTLPEPDPSRPERKPKPCRKHLWGPEFGIKPNTGGPGREYELTGRETCHRCPAVKDPKATRRGKNNRSRGLAIQREVARDLGMEHIPGNGPADARDDGFYAEVKSGPGWYSTRVEAELDNLPTDTGRSPIFVAASTPGPGGGKRRVYVTVTLGDLVKMVGPHAQVSMWAPEWMALKGVRNEAR